MAFYLIDIIVFLEKRPVCIRGAPCCFGRQLFWPVCQSGRNPIFYLRQLLCLSLEPGKDRFHQFAGQASGSVFQERHRIRGRKSRPDPDEPARGNMIADEMMPAECDALAADRCLYRELVVRIAIAFLRRHMCDAELGEPFRPGKTSLLRHVELQKRCAAQGLLSATLPLIASAQGAAPVISAGEKDTPPPEEGGVSWEDIVLSS